jgi:hypothetical protein
MFDYLNPGGGSQGFSPNFLQKLRDQTPEQEKQMIEHFVESGIPAPTEQDWLQLSGKDPYQPVEGGGVGNPGLLAGAAQAQGIPPGTGMSTGGGMSLPQSLGIAQMGIGLMQQAQGQQSPMLLPPPTGGAPAPAPDFFSKLVAGGRGLPRLG